MDDILPLGRQPARKAADLTPEQVAAAEIVIGDRGVPAPFRFLIASPRVVRHLGSLWTSIRKDSRLTPREREIVTLVTVTELNCAFVKAAHRKTGKSYGLSDAILDAILSSRTPEFSDGRERLVYELTLSLHREAPTPKEKAETFEKMLGLDLVADIIGYIAVYSATAQVMRFVDAPPPE